LLHTLTAVTTAVYSPWFGLESFDACIFHLNLTVAGTGLVIGYESTGLAAPTTAAGDGGPLNDATGSLLAPGSQAIAAGRHSFVLFGPLPRYIRTKVSSIGAAITGTIHIEGVKAAGMKG
jgi:hypothetical protein